MISPRKYPKFVFSEWIKHLSGKERRKDFFRIIQDYRYKPNELFKRMKVTTFVQLVIQVSSMEENLFQDDDASTIGPGSLDAELRYLQDEEMPYTARTESTIGGGDTERAPTGIESTMEGRDTARSTLHSLISGVGEHESTTNRGGSNQAHVPSGQIPGGGRGGADPSVPFLVLDVRTEDEYNECHVVSAKNFPVALLARSCNYETKEMLSYKNKPGRIILLYDEDERLAPKAAATLVERGYDNLFLLSGGLTVAVKLYPTGLVTGTPPPSVASAKKFKEKTTPSITRFHPENIDLLIDQTESAIQDKSSASRLSRTGTRASQASSAQSSARSTAMSTASTITDRPAFR